VGFYAIYFNRLSESDRSVFAFEPLKYNVKRLKKNLEINNISDINVFEYGLSSENTQSQLRFSEGNRGGASTSKLSGNKSETAEFRRMDEVHMLTSAKVGLI